jgi:hypothetical protein
MTDSDLKFKVTLDSYTGKMLFEENTTLLTAEELSSGIVKITDTLGNEVYKNVGYDTDDFSTPDIVNADSLKTSTEIQMLLGEDGKIINGDYTIEYKLEVFINDTLSLADVSVLSTNLKELLISGANSTDVDDLTKTGYIIVDNGVNAGTYLIDSFTYNGTDLVITTVVDLIEVTSVEDTPMANNDNASTSEDTNVITNSSNKCLTHS